MCTAARLHRDDACRQLFGEGRNALRPHPPSLDHRTSLIQTHVGARLPNTEKLRLHRVAAGDTATLLTVIAELRSRASARLGRPADVACCFEAGRDGFWLHRLLTAHGIAAYVLEPTSILVNRRARRAKTDRLDAEGMLRVLAAWLGGDRQVCSMVRVPYAGGGGCQASAPRARTPRAGQAAYREPDRGAAVHAGHPEKAVAAIVGARRRGTANGRRTRSAVFAAGRA